MPELKFDTVVILVIFELWDYDDERGTATLVGLRIQCRKCDCAVHMGRAEKQGFLDVAIAQLCKVNGIVEPEAMKLYRRARGVWSQRNKKQWRIVVEKSLLERYPELAALEQTVSDDCESSGSIC